LALLDSRKRLFIEQLGTPGNVAAVEYRKIGLIPLRFLARKGPQFRLFQNHLGEIRRIGSYPMRGI
jgi:hypothetical protein